MSGFLLSEIAQATGGRLLGEDLRIHSVSTDSRTIGPGDFFVALKGPNFDGRTFVKDALTVEVDHLDKAMPIKSFNEIAAESAEKTIEINKGEGDT